MFVVAWVVALTWLVTAGLWITRAQWRWQDRAETWLGARTEPEGTAPRFGRAMGWGHPGVRMAREQMRPGIERASRVLLVVCVVQIGLWAIAIGVGALVSEI